MRLEATSKFISLILRHDPSAIGVSLDANGWCVIADLLAGLASKNHAISRADLDSIVSSDSKKRYSISDDGTRIRANQGHSIKVDLGLTPVSPPAVLYHGTASRFREPILSDGLSKMSRQHLHLSTDLATAKAVGKRHGSVIVFIVDAGQMETDGHLFYQSDNGVWLTDSVPVKYLSEWQETHG